MNFDMTIGELLAGVKETNASIAKLIGTEVDGTPRYAIVVLIGKDTTSEILAAINALEDKWAVEYKPGPVS